VWASGGVIDNVATNARPATIISMSFSGAGACPSFLQSAVQQAILNGCVLIAAAGNNYGASSADYFPGNCVGVIAVEASTRLGVLADYSNRYGTLAGPGGDAQNPVVAFSLTPDETDILAVAVMGTSIAVTIVAGVLAMGLDTYGPSFNLGMTLVQFADGCRADECGPRIASMGGTTSAILNTDPDPVSQYTCSQMGMTTWNGTYQDNVIELNTTTAAWTSKIVACERNGSLVTAASLPSSYLTGVARCGKVRTVVIYKY
jgi:hypothetical protein